jgi:hypothetical protein
MGPHLPPNPLVASRCCQSHWRQIFLANYASQKKSHQKANQCTNRSLVARPGHHCRPEYRTANFSKRGIYLNYFKSCIFEIYVACKWATHSLGSRTAYGPYGLYSLMFWVKKLDRPICNEKPTWETSSVDS